MAGKLKENYDAKFLEAIDFAFKKCQFNFVPKAEQVQAIHAVVTGNDVFVRVATGFGKSVCYVVVPYVCDYLRPESEVSSQSVLLMVSPLKALMEDQIDDIRKCGISCLKLHGELPSEQLHDVGAGKFQILICSPESLHEESVREQFLKLQKNIVCMAVDEAHCVLQWFDCIYPRRGKEFRTAYGDLKQVRALLMHGVPVMALTATATHDMMKSIALALGMYQCTLVKRSCNRPNIYYEVQRMQNFAEEEFEKWKELLEGIFGGIVSDLKANGDAASNYFLFF
ncbi:ATP-dependent DNA helicase Q-like 3 [Acropora millepora]|uniref:ATP-dependent DNA helicase Q-like 3 n=1 Tax=Acropora millepora TaxID=45264 RepID=UPI001CF26C41|nr:ATP-dependent DNA helicase Q-like 3 [Acropora millepora]